VVPDVLEEHLEEMAYLAVQRRKLLFSPEIPLRRLPAHDERIAAHADGLAVGGPASVEVALTRLEDDDPWMTYSAARVVLELSPLDRAALLSRLVAVPQERRPSWREALRQVPTARLEALLSGVSLMDLAAPAQELAADALGWHGRLAPRVCATLAERGTEGARVAVARHIAGIAPEPLVTSALNVLLEAPQVEVRRRALWSYALRERANALRHCRALAKRGPEPFALRVLGLIGEGADDAALLTGVNGDPAVVAAATRALGDLRWPGAARVLVQRLSSKDEAIGAAAVGALEVLVGALPALAPEPEDPEKESPPAEPAAALPAIEKILAGLPAGSGCLRGKPYPWRGPTSEEPLECVWRASIVAPRPEAPWLRREVPDGFFSAAPSIPALPGE
jgi:hypothetical protein